MALIEFQNVSKRFVLHHERARSFQDLFVSMFRPNSGREEFWALRDISFQIEAGEAVAIVGPNGSGKSTTLKLISRILQPTIGKVITQKRVAALLELGTGFHPELTGRENVFLNGSLLGFGRSEMERRFDDIVEFAELEHFIDTPIKHFSTGMVMRLGFAVAIFTDPEVLVTDEILAVGDESFSRKCLDRIWQYRRQGKTILFVSHSLQTVRQLCNRAIWLDHGAMLADGLATDVVDQYVVSSYLSEEGKVGSSVVSPSGNRWGHGEAVISDVTFLDSEGKRREVFETGEQLTVRVDYVANQRIESPQFGVAIHRIDGLHINGPNNVASGREVLAIAGPGYFEYQIDRLPLLEGTFELTVAIYNHEATYPYDHHERMYRFHVRNGSVREREGVFQIPCTWRFSDDLAGQQSGTAHFAPLRANR